MKWTMRPHSAKHSNMLHRKVIVGKQDRSALCGTHLYKHFCRTKRKNDPLSFFDEGLHNYVVCNCVAVKPLRAGAHSHVQAHSFHYYGTLCLRPPSSPPLKDKQIQTACFFIYDGNSLRGGRTRALRKQWTPIVFSDDRSIEQDIRI